MMRNWSEEARLARLDHWADTPRPMGLALRGAVLAAMSTLQSEKPSISPSTFAMSPELGPLIFDLLAKKMSEDEDRRNGYA